MDIQPVTVEGEQGAGCANKGASVHPEIDIILDLDEGELLDKLDQVKASHCDNFAQRAAELKDKLIQVVKLQGEGTRGDPIVMGRVQDARRGNELTCRKNLQIDEYV